MDGMSIDSWGAMMADMLEAEFADPYRSWKKAPGLESNSSMLKTIDPIIDSAVQTYGSGDKSPLLRSRARKLALQSLHTYDPSKSKLRSHLMTQLQGLRRVRTQQNQIIGVPEQIQLDQGHLREAHTRMEDWLGRDPSDAELADETGLSLKRIAHTRKAFGGLSESQASGFDPETGEMGQPTIASGENDNSGWNEFVYMSLNPKDQLIFEHLAGLHGKKVLSARQVAAKVGVSPAAISQRAGKIQSLINQRESLGVL